MLCKGDVETLTIFPLEFNSTALPVLPPTNITSTDIDNARLVHQYLIAN